MQQLLRSYLFGGKICPVMTSQTLRAYRSNCVPERRASNGFRGKLAAKTQTGSQQVRN